VSQPNAAPIRWDRDGRLVPGIEPGLALPRAQES